MVLLQFPQWAADGKTGGINFVGAKLPIGNVWGGALVVEELCS
jgi:hypothetical protein